MVHKIKTKIVKTGSFYEVSTYLRPVTRIILEEWEKPKPKEKLSYGSTPEQKERSIKSSTSRAKMKVRRLILGNLFNNPDEIPKFVTLTFDRKKHPLCHNIDYVNYEFKKFRQRLQYNQGSLCAHKNIEYIATPEKHADGTHWHYHILFLNMTFTLKEELENHLWGNGFTNIQAVEKNPVVANYITKYFTKSYADETLKYKKRYFQALTNQPNIIIKPDEVSHLTPLLGEHNCIYTHEEVILNYLGEVLNVITKKDYLLTT